MREPRREPTPSKPKKLPPRRSAALKIHVEDLNQVPVQRYAEAQGFPPEIKVALARSLSHVILDGIDDMTDDMVHVPLYTLGETCYGIGGVR